MDKKVVFKRIKNDVNGNPRYVCHFFEMDVHGAQSGLGISERYEIAVKLANTIGGRRYHVKNFGGGLVFQSYSLDELVGAMARVTGKNLNGYEEAQ